MSRHVAALMLKWILVPTALATGGYFLLGPSVPHLMGVAPKRIEAKAEAEEGAKFDEPDVQVTSERLRGGSSSRVRASRDDEPKPRRRRRKRATPPPETAPPVEEPGTDAPPGDPPVDAPPPDTGDEPPSDPPA